MKLTSKALAVLTGILLIHSSTLFAAAKCAEVKGNFVVGKVTLGCTNVTGNATIKKTTFTGELKIRGDLKATESTFMSINVAGDVALNNSTVASTAKIDGKLMANNTTFQDKLDIKTQAITLNHATTHGIEIKATKIKKPVVVTINESTIDGDITFVDGNGVVKNHHATINGKVIGGKVE